MMLKAMLEELAGKMKAEGDPKLLAYAYSLECILKVAGGVATPSPEQIMDGVQRQIDKDRADRILEKRVAQKEELLPSLGTFVGGSSGGDSIPIDPAMPVGAKVPMGGEVYVHKGGGKLEFSIEETKRAYGQ